MKQENKICCDCGVIAHNITETWDRGTEYRCHVCFEKHLAKYGVKIR